MDSQITNIDTDASGNMGVAKNSNCRYPKHQTTS